MGEMEKSSVEVGFPVSRNSFCEGNYRTNDGNILMVRILDLTQDFESIKYDLEDLVNYKVI